MAGLDLNNLKQSDYDKFDDADLEKIVNIDKYKSQADLINDLSDNALQVIAGDKAPLAKEVSAINDSDLMSKGDAFKTSALKGVTLNTQPVIGGLAGGLGAMMGTSGGLKEKLAAFGPAYQESRKELVDQQDKASTDRPGYSIGGEIVGGLATAPFIALKGIQGAARMGAAYGAGDALSRDQNLKEGLETTFKGAAFGAGTAGLMKAAPSILKATGNAAKSVGKTALRTAFGVNKDAVETYLQRAESVKSAKSVEEIKNIMDKTVQSLFDDVDKSKITQDEAKQLLRTVEDQIKTTAQESGFQFKINQADLKESLNSASNKLEKSFGSIKDKLSAVKSPVDLVDDVATSIQDLKAKVIKGSNEAYSILDNDSQAYSVRGGGKLLREKAAEMDIKSFGGNKEGLVPEGVITGGQNSGPVTAQTAGVQNELRSFAQRLENTPEKVPAREIKKILQQIDASEKALYGQPGFDGRVSQAYKEVRAIIDQAIKKQNPEYKAKMEEVAKDTGILSKALERFGDPRASSSRLKNINSATAVEDRKILESLGNASERDFSSPVSEFSSAQATLKNPKAMDAIKSAIPESQMVSEKQAQLAQMSRPEARGQFVDQEINRSGLLNKKTDAEKGLASAIESLKTSQERLDPYKSLGPFSTQNAIKGLMKTPGKESIELRKTIEGLSKMSGEDFANMIKDRATKDAFDGEFRAGSRNVNLWSIFGGVIGAAGGGLPGGGVGAAAGATVGAMVDRFGPKMAQKTLDAVLKIQGSPTVQKISSLSLPDNVKAYLTQTLIQTQNSVMNKSDAMKRRQEQLSNPK